MAVKTSVLAVLWMVAVIVATTEASNSTTVPPTSNSTVTASPAINSTVVSPPPLTNSTNSTATSPPTNSTNSTATPPPTNSTNSTATPQPTTTSTVATPPTTTSTVAPPPTTTSTVAPPPTTSSTAAPPPTITSTVAPQPTTTSTVTPPPSTTTTDPPTTQPPDPCDPNPCGDGSSCEARANLTHVCLCRSGDTYNDDTSSCVRARVFPGRVQTNESYSDELATKTSPEFAEVSQRIIDDMRIRLRDLENVDPVVLDLLPSDPVSRSNGRTVTAVVQIIFPANSDVTSETLSGALEAPCDDCTVTTSVGLTSLCSDNPCETNSSTCSETNGGFTCQCRPGFIVTSFTDRLCVVACGNGQELKDNKCVHCPFGYTGFNCEEAWQLYLVIAASVLGGLLLISIILVAVFASKSSKKSKKSKGPQSRNTHENTLLGTSTFDFTQRATGERSPNGFGSIGNDQAPRIPRATANNGWGSRTNLEMTQSNSRQNLIPSTRPQNNPYAVNRPQVNPYTQSTGNTNASYMH